MRIYRRSAWTLLILLLPLLALKCKKDDIIKAKQFEVTVRVTGENLTGLGAEMQVNSRLDALNLSAGPSLTYAYATSVSQTYVLGTFELQDDVTAAVAFKNVTCSSALQPASNSKLKVELFANGLLVNVVELTPTSQGDSFACAPYWADTSASNSDDWD